MLLAGSSLLAAPLLARSEETPGVAVLDAYQRLSGSFDDRLIIWWMDGKQYGVVSGKAQPLFGMKVGMFHHFYAQTDGSYKLAFFELTYFTDLNSGELLTEFNNPYTGKTNKVRHTRLGPEIRTLNSNGLAGPENPFIKNYRSSLGPATVSGDNIWIPSSVNAKIKFPKPEAPEILLNIHTTISGSLTDANNTGLTSAPCTLAFNNIQKWMPWMDMKDAPGNMMGVAHGRKMESLSELPQDYMACAETVHPRYISNPTAALSKQISAIKGA